VGLLTELNLNKTLNISEDINIKIFSMPKWQKKKLNIDE